MGTRFGRTRWMSRFASSLTSAQDSQRLGRIWFNCAVLSKLASFQAKSDAAFNISGRRRGNARRGNFEQLGSSLTFELQVLGDTKQTVLIIISYICIQTIIKNFQLGKKSYCVCYGIMQ